MKKTYTVAKKNAGTPKTYSTEGRLISAVRRAGALDARLTKEGLEVSWPGDRVLYSIDKDGVIEPQLAWDMEK